MSSTIPAGDEILEFGRVRVNAALERWLPTADSAPPRLAEAMRYAVLGTGKRLRPALVYAAGQSLRADPDELDAPAAAVELIHAYSLVHDDLPAMDDDDLRRGAPTCHRQFDEATAILTGDALQALALELLVDAGHARRIDPALRVRMVTELATAAGAAGMAGGQALDLAAAGQRLELSALERMHRHKTGALIRASVVLGGLAGRADEHNLTALGQYGEAIGLAFQIVDDILDVTADTAILGKAQGADAHRGKPTYPALLGLDGARQHAEHMRGEALAALDRCTSDRTELRTLANFITGRSW